MWKSYFKIVSRHLWKNRSYTFINLLGLTVGIACCLLILIYVQDELSYDKWHDDGDRIYRMALERKYPGRSRNYAIIPQSYGATIKDEFPEVEDFCRLFYFQGANMVIKQGSQTFEENQLMWADSNFFQLFNVPLLAGDESTALVKPNTVVLTESQAEKFFGSENPIGKVLDIAQNNQDLEVTGVCADLPDQTHLAFNMLISSSTLGFLQQPNYINFSAYTYLLLSPNADPAQVEAKLPDLVTKYASGQVMQQFGVNYEAYQKQGNGYIYTLQALPDIYLTSNLEAEIKPPGSMERIKFFVLIAGLILLIACINFMNLSTARSAGRAREVGIRKTLGSGRHQLTFQFLTEAFLNSLVSTVLAYGLALALLQPFNALTGKDLPISSLLDWRYLLLIPGIAVLTGLLSGTYPAFFLSRFKPMEVLRGRLYATKKGAGLRRVLVVFQFGVSVFLIISTIMVYRQMSFAQNKALGFNKSQLLTVQNAGSLTAQQEETFKEELRKLSGVEMVSGCSSQPGQQYFGMSFRPPGGEESTTGSGLIVDEDYIECMEMEMVAGRTFSREFMDTLSIVVNEAAVREMELGTTDAVGTRLVSSDAFLNPDENEPSVYTIIGVVKDFHFQSLHNVVSPLFLVHNQRSFTAGVDPLITVRLGATDLQQTIAGIEGLWKQFLPDMPFNYQFLDQEWAQLYEKEQNMQQVYSVFSLLAIFIACLGLLALAAYTVETRTKEIGIRKVLGATTGGIIGLLSRDFLKLVLLSIVIASPFAWWTMREWLQDFAYRVSIEWWVFVLAGIIAIGIAFLTVSLQSVKAALANPVKSLRSE
ncbi:ABC transporter permease [Flavilitoribacter nigricans]|uniref:ABC transporter permease n=1 Tax=Flavilitoribacter nigricans (strain ATCC 23147 / DSM 23189 / NBRC 102662 / NCIMB 1420 / SS-2) TaxID=1122177 RepID=A0A2D0N5N6_FLAN2|nr:ABC transporter permease [Flavilitoribacter nigricans]PHN03757.1 ABC transporter permease [Flavilitoribacter nigricans DSM 23189 = NBRC 102662]